MDYYKPLFKVAGKPFTTLDLIIIAVNMAIIIVGAFL